MVYPSHNKKLADLEKAGWTIGTAAELLGLSIEDQEYISALRCLTDLVLEKQRTLGLPESVPEAGSMPFDFLFEELFRLGVTLSEIGRALAHPNRQ